MKFSFTSKADRSQRDVDGRKRKACFCLLFFTLSVVFLYWQNNGLTITEYDIIHFLRREMLDFTAFPVFFVSNLLLVQRKKYYFNRATVSRNCSIVL